MLRSTLSPIARGLAVAALLAAPSALAQDARSAFHEAYYLQHEEGDLEHALALYRKVAKAKGADQELRARAAALADGIAEDLAASDFARLLPPDTILFAELDRPGQQVASLLDQLGLLGEAHHVSAERIAVSPLLVQHLLDLRGAAVAITAIDPRGGEPDGVLVLHPGDHAGLRGAIDTLLPAGGTAVEAIGGFPTWSVEGQAFVCLTSRLVVAARDRHQIEGVVRRLAGDEKGSLADHASLAQARKAGGDALVRFFVNAEPVKPMIRMLAQQQAQNDPGAAMALKLLDLDSLQGLSGSFGVREDGLGLDVALDLEQGHRNIVFNLMRRPTVGRATLELVPEGAAFFLASAFNPAGAVAPIDTDSHQQPVVSLLDFGREWFANVVDAALYGMPPAPGAGQGLPDVALVLRVNDVERSLALWELVLETVSGATGAEPKSERIAGNDVMRYAVQGVPVYLATHDNRLVISPNRGSVERSLSAWSGQSVASDPVFAASLGVLDESPTMILAASPGRCAEMAMPFAPAGERQQMAPIAHMLGETALVVTTQQSDTRLAFGARVRNLPDVSGVITQLVAQRRGGLHAYAGAHAAAQPRLEAKPSAVAIASAPKGGPEALRKKFDALAGQGEDEAANRIAEQIAATAGDANWLNGFAWQLLTEKRYGQRFDAVARVLSLRSNELSDWSSWYFLDTLALAEFRAGHVGKAVELQKKAVEKAAGDPRAAEAEKNLKRYLEALEAAPSIVRLEAGAGE